LANAGTDLTGDAGHPVLADCAAWRDLAREVGAEEAAPDANALVARILNDYGDRWREHAEAQLEQVTPTMCFRLLAEARELDLEAIYRGQTELPLADARPRLRERFKEVVAATPPPEEAREAWVTELRDRADAVLVSLDDIDPRRAGALAKLVTRELQWHLDHIEPTRGGRRRRLKQRIRRLAAERQERDLQQRLELRWGAKKVARFERFIFWLIILVLGMLTVEMLFDLPHKVIFWMAIIDTAACCVFLWEIAVKLWMVRGKWFWFYRHFFVDVLPSIPFSLLLLNQAAFRSVRFARPLRFLRISRFGRYIRLLRPIMRIVRAIGFLWRGSDRLVRKYGRLLNRNIVLYPTRAERAAMNAGPEGLGPRVRQLQSDLNERWADLLATAPRERRNAVVRRRVDSLEQVRAGGGLLPTARTRQPPTVVKEIAAEEVLRRLSRLSPEGVEAETGQDFVSRIARAVRVFARPPLRWLPVFRRYVPRVAAGMSDAEVVVAAAHTTAAELERHHDRWLWFADLHGTVTPSQFVDRVGSAMVKAAFRPAYRLVLFGLIVLVFKGVFAIADVGKEPPAPGTGTEPVATAPEDAGWLKRTVGPFLQRAEQALFDFLFVLGGICFAILGVGLWLRHVAGQATDFFAKSASAQYLSLTESIKGRHLERDAAIITKRVLAPEHIARDDPPDPTVATRFVSGVTQWLLSAQPGHADGKDFSAMERVILLYRDSLDGALLADSDTRSTSQLLGNPALRNLRIMSQRLSPADDARLRRLDLEHQRTFVAGPYLWFRLVNQAIAHGVARLIVDYNRRALPLAQLERCTPVERAIYDAWLNAEQIEGVPSEKVRYVTTQFTALHFLDDDPQRDVFVEERFGDRVAERLRRDRRYLIRRIFGGYPLHNRPHEERVLNPFRFYQRLFAGGRALLLPFRAIWSAGVWIVRLVRGVVRAVREVRNPSLDVDHEAADGADFHAALRKIRRMRGPAAEAALRLRIRFDPEYLGVRLPGTEHSGLEKCDVDDDLRFLSADPALEREARRERRRASRDMVRLGRLLRDGALERICTKLSLTPDTFTRQHLRAAACAYVADFDGVRRRLSTQELLQEIYERAVHDDLLPSAIVPRPRLYRIFRRWWNAHGV
ncbi:MAG: ion transporter, partial [Planctomycetota bacterium]|nr:ion transporter [Planctomycetota bacterium]